MLFSPPKEFGKQFFYKLVGISCTVHVGLLVSFFLVETWHGMRPIVIPLRNTQCRVSMVSSRPGSRSSNQSVPKKAIAQRAQPRKNTQTKKAAPKKKAPAKKKAAAKKVPVKKEPIKRAPQKAPVKEPKKEPVKVPMQKTQPKQEPPKPLEVQKKPIENTQQKAVEETFVPEGPQEVNITEVALAENSIEYEFGRHFTLPAGFEDYESFTITFDIENCKVINVSPHTKGALVIYTAVKDALLKSTMPIKNRKNIVWHIT